MAHAARNRRHGWFAAITVSLVLASVVGIPPFTRVAQEMWLFNRDLATHIQSWTGIPGDAPIDTTFYLIMSAVMVVAPLAALLYGLWGGGRRELAQPAPVPSDSGDASVTAITR